MKYVKTLLKILLTSLMEKAICQQAIKNNKELTRDSSNSNNIKTENLKIFERLSSDIKSIYQKLERFIFDLNPSEIEKVKTKQHIAFKIYNMCFVDFVFKSSKIPYYRYFKSDIPKIGFCQRC